MDKIDELIRKGISRRKFLAGIGFSAGAAGAVALAGCGGNGSSMQGSTPPTTPPKTAVTDADVLNFALNLEYLEAEFYVRAVTGSGLSSADTGGSGSNVTGGTKVPFKTPALQQIATEIANDELAHVRFLRKALGSAAVSEPAIDLQNSFNAAAMAAGIGPSFNPFADENSFIVGAFTFEDVGVTAYHGAAGLLSSKTNLGAAAAIMSVEAYHAAGIRTLLTQLGGAYLTYANQISSLRGMAGGGAETTLSGTSIVAADSNSIAFDRNTDQVLHIVYLNGSSGTIKSGGFFPDGLNGAIASTTS